MIDSLRFLAGSTAYLCRLRVDWLRRRPGSKKAPPQEEVADGFSRGHPSAALSGRTRPYARGEIDADGRIHLVGESAVATDACGAQIRYLVIDSLR